MSLYSSTDSVANQTKAGRGIANSSQSKTIVHVNDTEAQLDENKSRGITSPGWWSYFTYTDASGKTRHKSELLVTLSNAGVEVVADDTIAADVTSTITINNQPSDVTGAADPFTGTFDVAGADVTFSAGTGIYQWQRQTATGTRWTNITNGGVFSGATTDTLTLTAAAKADYDGYKFRVKITSTEGAEEVVSDAATLTYA